MLDVNPVITNGFDVVAVQPVVAAVGAREPHGKAITCHDVEGPALVHPQETEDDNNALVVNATGCGQAGGGPHVMLDTQPVEVVFAFEIN